MADTVTVTDPATGDTFRVTRNQYERLHKPRGRFIADDQPIPSEPEREPDPEPTPEPED